MRFRPWYILVFCGLAVLILSNQNPDTANTVNVEVMPSIDTSHQVEVRGALIGTRFSSMNELLSVIRIEYYHPDSTLQASKPQVKVWHRVSGKEVCAVLEEGISQGDFLKARDGGLMQKAALAFRSPYTAMHKRDLERVYNLSRRRHDVYGIGDVAFFDLAESMMCHISEEDRPNLCEEDFTEKGYINTFNHINAQAFMSSIFSERLADFIADVHERYNMPELISGDFTKEQLEDLESGPLDNYVDMVNNEWGQELGKELQAKYKISSKTCWTPELLADYLNELQRHYAYALQIGFRPFQHDDEVVVRFADKINRVMGVAPAT